MATAKSRVLGSLVSNLEFDDNSCIPNTKQSLYDDLIKNLSVELPSEDEDVFIVVSSSAPEDRSKLWLQTGIDGFPLKLNKWSGSAWLQLQAWGRDHPVQFIGNPDNPPSGWTTYDSVSGIDLSGSFIPISNGDTLYYAYFSG